MSSPEQDVHVPNAESPPLASDDRSPLLPDEEFQILHGKARAGDRDAIDQLYRRFAKDMQRVARARLSHEQRLRFLYDEHDLLQSVWASMLAHNRLDQPFGGPEQFMAFLEVLILCKALKIGRYLRQKKRDSRRVVSFESLQEVVRELTDDRQPSPVEVAIDREQWRRLLEANTPTLRIILDRRRLGFTQTEIAAEIFLSVRTVCRLLDMVQVPPA